MNIVCATDDNFVQHCATMLTSLLKNNKHTFINIYILTENLKEENSKLLNSIFNQNNCGIHIINVNPDILKDCPMPEASGLNHISIATYYRLLIPVLLPKVVDKVIYFDCDIIIRHSILDLWEYPIDNYALGAVYQIGCRNDVKRLGYSLSFGYFNAGVLLINLKYWRTHNIYSELFRYLREKKQIIFYHDQDTLNGVLHDKCVKLPCKWNMVSSFFYNNILDIRDTEGPELINDYSDYKNQIVENINDPAVIHYVSYIKPWHIGCTHPYKKEYYKYLKYTPWHQYTPPSLLKAMVSDRNKIFIIFKNFIRKLIFGNPYFKIKITA